MFQSWNGFEVKNYLFQFWLAENGGTVSWVGVRSWSGGGQWRVRPRRDIPDEDAWLEKANRKFDSLQKNNDN